MKNRFLDYYIKYDDQSGKIKVNTLTIATTATVSGENFKTIHSFYKEIEAEEICVTGDASIRILPGELVGVKRFIIAAGCTLLQQYVDGYEDLIFLQYAQFIKIDMHPDIIQATALCKLLSMYKEKPSVIEADNEKVAQKILSITTCDQTEFEKQAIIKSAAQKFEIDIPQRSMVVKNIRNAGATHFVEVDHFKILNLVLECLNEKPKSFAKFVGLLKKVKNPLKTLRFNVKSGKIIDVLQLIENDILPKVTFTRLNTIILSVSPGGKAGDVASSIARVISKVSTLAKISIVRERLWRHLATKDFQDMRPSICILKESKDMITYEYSEDDSDDDSE